MAGFNATGGIAGQGKPVVRTLLQNVLVLAVPKDAESIEQGKTGDVTLRVTDKQAAAVAFAVENGKLWMSLRPPAGASQERPAAVDIDGIISDSPALQLEEGR
jgi:Flp pilus assembly protein CpaB